MSKSSLQPVNKGNLSEQVYAAVRNALMDGKYEPGERLTISGLASELGVSITPVRETIFRLVSERALEMKAATAIHVPEISADQLREIQTIRMLLEGKAAEVAASKVTPKQFAKLEETHKAFQETAAKNPMKAAYLNREFHFALMEIAEMPMLYATVENMWTLMGPLLRIYHVEAPSRDLTSGRHGHFDVLQALKERDGAMAQKAIQDDISLGLNMVAWIEARALEAPEPGARVLSKLS